MMNALFTILFLLTSVIIGGALVILLERKNYQQLIKLTLAFSGGFLLAIAFTHFLPELYEKHHTYIGVWVLVGFLVQLFLEYFSGGIEHGHIHVHGHRAIPIAALFSLSVHSFIEGIPLADIQHAVDNQPGHHHDSLLLGILFHQLPVAIALMTLLRQSALSKRMSWGLLMVFGVMTPLGLLFGYSLESFHLAESMDYLLAIVVGMFLHISTTIIFETNEQHTFNLAKLTAILVGVGLTFFLW